MNDKKDISAQEKKEIKTLVSLGKKFLYQNLKQVFNSHGLEVTPSNFYSNTPSVDDINGSFEYEGDKLPYLDDQVFDDEYMVKFLDELSKYSTEFSPEASGDIDSPKSFFWENPLFSFSDAMAYYSMIRFAKPKRILEIGSGWSTLIANQAMKKNGFGEIISIEPYPPDFLEKIPKLKTCYKTKVQEQSIELFNDTLQDGDILFIDSTHTVKTGSDCLYLYLTILPKIEANIMIHVHDIFLPAAMPPSWALEKHIYWTEQYLLFAYLLNNKDNMVCFGSNYHDLLNKEKLDQFMQEKYPSGGGSLWFKKTALNLSCGL